MNCEIWDEEIALHAGADEVSPAFLAHVSGCGRCQSEVAAVLVSMREWTDWSPQVKKRRPPYWLAAAALLPLAFLKPEPIEILSLAMPPAPVAPKVEFTPKPVIAKRPSPSVTVKLFTDDPDVIILLVGDAE